MLEFPPPSRLIYEVVEFVGVESHVGYNVARFT